MLGAGYQTVVANVLTFILSACYQTVAVNVQYGYVRIKLSKCCGKWAAPVCYVQAIRLVANVQHPYIMCRL
jgi:hypothetical protein